MILWFVLFVCLFLKKRKNNFPDIQFYQLKTEEADEVVNAFKTREAEKEPSLTSSTDFPEEKGPFPSSKLC